MVFLQSPIIRTDIRNIARLGRERTAGGQYHAVAFLPPSSSSSFSVITCRLRHATHQRFLPFRVIREKMVNVDDDEYHLSHRHHIYGRGEN